jgi:formylglycine-generating enzyme required for sulfatase activity
LSFQEFLAGQRLTDVEDDLLKVFLERAEVPEWHNTLSLLFSGLTREKAARLVAGVVQAFDGRALGVRQVTADCLNTQLARGVRLDAATEQTCREAFLVTMLAQAHPVDRSGVASTLGRLGDPRFRVDRLCLPDEELLGFIRVDAGIFTMGSDPRVDPHAREEEQPQHLVELPEYYIARYPVTVAQFSAFVVDSGFKVGDPDCLRGVPNHPVVDVTFYEALAYCDWLTDRLTSADWTPPLLRGQLDDGWVITLPSEAEWEKAARGRGGRIYPWGHEFDDLKVNGDRTGLRATSSVGMFPDGASRCGALDMSGNVWECTRSLWRDERGKPGYRYPYRADDAERENVHAPGSIQRVMRGGAFYSDARDLRAATRSSVDPLGRHVDIGFRLVSSRVRR